MKYFVAILAVVLVLTVVSGVVLEQSGMIDVAGGTVTSSKKKEEIQLVRDEAAAYSKLIGVGAINGSIDQIGGLCYHKSITTLDVDGSWSCSGEENDWISVKDDNGQVISFIPLFPLTITYEGEYLEFMSLRISFISSNATLCSYVVEPGERLEDFGDSYNGSACWFEINGSVGSVLEHVVLSSQSSMLDAKVTEVIAVCRNLVDYTKGYNRKTGELLEFVDDGFKIPAGERYLVRFPVSGIAVGEKVVASYVGEVNSYGETVGNYSLRYTDGTTSASRSMGVPLTVEKEVDSLMIHKKDTTTVLEGDVVVRDLMLEYGTSATSYIRYFDPKVVFTVPADIVNLPGYGVGLDSHTFNYLDLKRSVFVNVCFVDDLGNIVVRNNALEIDVRRFLKDVNLDFSLYGVAELRFINVDQVDVPSVISYRMKVITS